MIKVNYKVILDTDKSYSGVVTKIKGNTIWIDGKVTGFSSDRWIKSK